jgi:hypothetical protein
MRIPEGMNQMSQQRRWKRPIAERVRGSAGAVARRHYLSIAAVVLAVAACVTLAPRALSEAARTPGAVATASAFPTATSTVGPTKPKDDGGLTYTTNNDLTETTTHPPGDPNPKDATCHLDSHATVSSPNDELTKVHDSINDEKDDWIDKDGIGALTASADPVTKTSMQVDGNAEVDCSLVNQADAYLKQAGDGSLGHFATAVLDAYRHPAAPGSRPVLLAYAALPQFLKNAIAAIAGAVMYIAVSSIVAAAMVALGASLTGGSPRGTGACGVRRVHRRRGLHCGDPGHRRRR